MILLRNNYLKFFILIGFIFLGDLTFANAAKIPTQDINITGVVHINKDPSENGYIPFKRYVFQGDSQYIGPADRNTIAQGLTIGTIHADDTNYAFDIISGIYYTTGTRDSRGDTWQGSQPVEDLILSSPGDVIISVYTGNKGTDFTGQYSLQSTVGYIEDKSNRCAKVSGLSKCATIRLSLTLIVSNSTCLIITEHNMAFIWSPLSPSQINNGSAEIKTAPVTMKCSDVSGAEPVAITFTSTNGNYDAEKGIVKTNLENLGLQLTWASNGQPIQMNKEIDFPALSTATEDFSVNAIPVQLGNTSVGGGHFSTMVTMSIEYR